MAAVPQLATLPVDFFWVPGDEKIAHNLFVSMIAKQKHEVR